MDSLNGSKLPDTNHAPTFLIVTGIFTALVICLCSARIYCRIRPKVSLRMDDYLILIATIMCTANYFTAVASSVHGWGHRSAYVSSKDQRVAFKCLFAQEIVWILAIALARISIAWSLISLSPERAWKWVLWLIIGVQIVTYIGHMIFQLWGCRPIRYYWTPVYDLHCWDRKYVLWYGWVSNGILVAIDFILAIMPVHLIRTLNRPIGEKILICCLMALGLIAGAIAAYRIKISDSTFSGDLLSSTVMMSLWCMLEVLLGIMAACMARLKAPAEQYLRRLGFLASPEITKPSFVRSVHDQDQDQDQEFYHPSDRLDLPDFPHIDGESEKDSRNNKSVTSTVDEGRLVH